MSLVMIVGSIIAGCTPLGGAVAAFPVAVLLLNFVPAEGRDFAVLIQSIGMNAATFVIMMHKRDFVNQILCATFIAAGVPGILLGLLYPMSPLYTTLVFQLIIFQFAILYFYMNHVRPRHPINLNMHKSSSGINAVMKRRGAYAVMVIAAALGGFLTAQIGAGSDIVMYMFGVLIWNPLFPDDAYSELTLTTTSVVCMGILSTVTAACRILTGFVKERVLLCWGASAMVVVFGAPVGSLLLVPSLRHKLRNVLYFVAIAQLVGFMIKNAAVEAAWIVIGITTVATLCLITADYYRTLRRKKCVESEMSPSDTQSATSEHDGRNPVSHNGIVHYDARNA